MHRAALRLLSLGSFIAAGVFAGACGGGADDAPPPAMPTQQTAAPSASSASPVASQEAPPPVASAPAVPVTLPASFVAAADAVKTATDKLTPVLTKSAPCDVLAKDLRAFAKANAPLFLTFNTEAAKLSDAQQQLAQDEAMKKGNGGADEQAKMMEAVTKSALGQCVQKKDPKVVAAFREFVGVMTAGMNDAPLVGGLAGSAMAPPPPPPAGSAAPAKK